LFPLLFQKRLEVSRIAVDGLTLNLISRGPKDNPVTNWQDLAGEKSQPSATSSSGSTPSATIGAIDVRNSSLMYRDETARSTTALTNLELHAGRFGAGVTVPTTIAFDYGQGVGKPVMHIALKANVATPADFSSVRLSDLDLALNQTHIAGSLSVENLKTLALQFDLSAGNLDLDRLFPPINTPATARAAPAATKAPPTPLPVDALRKLNARGTLRVKSLTVRRLVFTGVVLPVAAKDGRVHLGPAEAGLFGGRYDGDISIDARPALAQLSVSEHIKGVDIGATMKALYNTSRIIGRADANATLSGVGNTDAAILATLNGKFDANVKDGAIDGVDLWFELRQARALVKREALPAQTGPQRTPFKTLTATGTVESGVVRNDDLQIDTDYLKASGRGTLDLKTEAVDYHLTAQLHKLPPQGAAGSELADLKVGEIPISITGSLASLKVRPDIETLARQEVKGKLQQKTDELKQKLGDKLRGLFGH
jgi:AsmA protein